MKKQAIPFFFIHLILGIFTYSCNINPSNLELTKENKKSYENHYNDSLDSLYQLKQPITLIDKITYRKKEGYYIRNIYLGNEMLQQEFVEIKGVLKRVPYPRSYYSTKESPQGCFGDTNITHYRLAFENYDILRSFPSQKFKGRTTNIDGQAAFIYEFADSEVFFLDNHSLWKDEELNQTIELTAVLIQFIDGKSVLKNWKITSTSSKKH